jgi:serine/threonine protein kinase
MALEENDFDEALYEENTIQMVEYQSVLGAFSKKLSHNNELQSTEKKETGSESILAPTTNVEQFTQSVVQNIFKNKRSSIDLVSKEQQRYIVKTTQSTLGKQEYKALSHLQGLPCVPTLLSKPVYRGDKVALTMSWCPGVHPCTFATQSELKIFLNALLSALQEIHKRGIVHNDIKEPNIIWNSTTSSIHLIDFGCATATSGETQSHTPGYNAPDHIKTPASDVYSAGIVLMNVILNVAIRSSLQAYKLRNCTNLKQVLKWKSDFPELSCGDATLFNDKLFDLGRRMIASSIDERITIKSAMKHSFFENKAKPTNITAAETSLA